MSPKIKMTKHSINILAVTFFIATCLLMTKYNFRKPFINRAFEEDDEKSEKYHESKMQNLFSAATSGKEFSGDRIRTFPNHQRKFTDKNFKLNKLKYLINKYEHDGKEFERNEKKNIILNPGLEVQ